MKRSFLKSVLLFSSVFTLLFACNREENNLLGSWKFQQRVVRGGEVVSNPDSIEFRIEKKYNFNANGVYTVDVIEEIRGEDKLSVARGNWELENLEQEGQEKTMLTLREKQLTRTIEETYEIENLGEDSLVWLDNRKSKYFFKKVEDNI